MRTNRSVVKTVKNRIHQSSNHPVFGELLWRAAYDIVLTEEKLHAKASSIVNDMSRLLQQLEKAEKRPHFNGLGELQGQGPELDRLCGILDAAYENFDRIYAAWNYVVLHKPDRPGGKE